MQKAIEKAPAEKKKRLSHRKRKRLLAAPPGTKEVPDAPKSPARSLRSSRANLTQRRVAWKNSLLR